MKARLEAAQAVPAASWFRRSLALLGNASLTASSIALVLLVAEAGTRTLSRTGPSLLVNDPGVGKRYVPGFEGRVFVDEAGTEIALRFNREGFRGPERGKQKPPGTFRIAVLGDSMIAAVATHEDRTLVSLVERSLRSVRPDRAWEVMNFGVSSASTGQELVLFRQTVWRYGADLVLLAFFVGNDLGDNCSRLTSAPRIYFELDEQGRLEQGPAPSRSSWLVQWLDLHSRFYVWQKVAFRRIRAQGRRLSGEIEPGFRIFRGSGDKDVEYAWRVTGALVRTLAREVEGQGGRLGMLVIPCAEQVDDQLWEELSRRAIRRGERFEREAPQRRIRAICASAGVPVLSLTESFRAHSADRAAPGLFLGGRFHLSDAGHRVAAEAVARFLTEGEGRPLIGLESGAEGRMPQPAKGLAGFAPEALGEAS